MISLNDFNKPDGTTDWEAYHKAQVAAGDVCDTCRTYIMAPNKDGGRRTCNSCQRLIMDRGEVDHDDFIRCPKCGDHWDPQDNDDYDIFSDGEHMVCCPKCDYEFEVSVNVSYTFTSPELEDDDGEEEHGEGEGPGGSAEEG